MKDDSGKIRYVEVPKHKRRHMTNKGYNRTKTFIDTYTRSWPPVRNKVGRRSKKCYKKKHRKCR